MEGTDGKQEQKQVKPRASFSEWYDRNYKKLVIVAFLIFLIPLIYLVIFYMQHGDIMNKDVTLTGGTTITVYDTVDTKALESALEPKLGDVVIRKLEDITTRRTIAFVVETKADAETTKAALEDYLKYKLNDENSSIEVSGSALAKSFYNQLLIAMLVAFVFMSIVVFFVFRSFVPSMAVVFAAATDIIGALAMADIFGIRVSTAGIAAFLMLIGYSVDTDTMLTTKVVKRMGEGTVNSRIKSAFKTGIVMTLTAIVAVVIGYFIAQSSVIKEIFIILTFGLFFDILTTWIGNAAMLKWYAEKRRGA